jgi:hypothetical protein
MRKNNRVGISPAIEKQREKRRLKESKSFGEFGEKWLTAAPMADRGWDRDRTNAALREREHRNDKRAFQ